MFCITRYVKLQMEFHPVFCHALRALSVRDANISHRNNGYFRSVSFDDLFKDHIRYSQMWSPTLTAAPVFPGHFLFCTIAWNPILPSDSISIRDMLR